MAEAKKPAKPRHPGETLRDEVLPALGLGVSEAAAELGVSRVSLSRLLNGRAGVSPEMALRLERWIGADSGSRADLWLRLQAACDLWEAEKAARAVLRKIQPRAAGTVDLQEKLRTGAGGPK